ncbi:MAG: hypothetical protein IJY79_02620 [Clostridia bacterium]|nr:hypothetical protein [Clostridia bacterium]
MKSNLIYDYVPCKISFDGSKVSLPQSVQFEIKRNWDNLISSGKQFMNNELFTIDSIEVEDFQLKINVKKTLYDHYLYSVGKKFIGEHICRSLASNILILTSDNYYVLAVMSGKTSLPNKVKFIGGSLSEEDLTNSILDPLKCVKRETYEEIGLKFESNINITPRYFMTRANLSFVNILYVAEIDMSHKDIKDLFDRYKKKSQNSEFELNNILFVKNDVDEIKSFIKESRQSLIDYMEELFYVLIGESEAKSMVEEIIDKR